MSIIGDMTTTIHTLLFATTAIVIHQWWPSEGNILSQLNNIMYDLTHDYNHNAVHIISREAV